MLALHGTVAILIKVHQSLIKEKVNFIKILKAIDQSLTLPMLRLLSQKHMDAKIFEKHLNAVMLVLIGKLSLSTLR